MLSDGEINEGSNWESILFAPHHKLDNLVAIIDYNKIQSLGNTKDVLDLHSLAYKFIAFNWAVREVDGHDHLQIREAFSTIPLKSGRPTCIIAHTTKGKGVDFMENQLLWHYRTPSNELFDRAILQTSRPTLKSIL
jgi:transketolase